MIEQIQIMAGPGKRARVFIDSQEVTARVQYVSVSLTAGEAPVVRLEMVGLTLEVLALAGGEAQAAPLAAPQEQQPAAETKLAVESTKATPPAKGGKVSKKSEPPMFTEADDEDPKPSKGSGGGTRGGW